jgi:hypothetical protein
MDPIEKPAPQTGWLDRFRQSWFPPAAVVGAFAAFTTAAWRTRPALREFPAPAAPVPAPRPPGEPVASTRPTRPLERKYAQSAVLGALGSPYARSLAGIAVSSGDRIWTLGGDEIRAFGPDGGFIRSWKLSQRAACLTAGPDGRVYVGSRGRVDIYDEDGSLVSGFPAGDPGKPGFMTAIQVFQDEILVGDAGARVIRRYTPSGRQLGEIGTQNKTGGFMLPNGSLDFAVDAGGVVRATDPGRHRVTAWALDGSPLGYFGKFGQHNPEDFTGCCNPVNLAVTPDGKIVTGEKAGARVKVYEPDGTLLAMIGPEHFDAACTHVHLAVDSKGRILAADPVRREVKVFSL